MARRQRQDNDDVCSILGSILAPSREERSRVEEQEQEQEEQG